MSPITTSTQTATSSRHRHSPPQHHRATISTTCKPLPSPSPALCQVTTTLRHVTTTTPSWLDKTWSTTTTHHHVTQRHHRSDLDHQRTPSSLAENQSTIIRSTQKQQGMKRSLPPADGDDASLSDDHDLTTPHMPTEARSSQRSTPQHVTTLLSCHSRHTHPLISLLLATPITTTKLFALDTRWRRWNP